ELEPPLDYLQQVDRLVRRGRGHAGGGELAVEVLDVERVAVVVQQDIRLGQQAVRGLDHLVPTVVELRVKVELVFVQELRDEADHPGALAELVTADALIQKAPHTSDAGASLDVQG